ncbi:MAG: LPS export ABC transporter periplasmic protein LptC [Fusobacteriia bacterium 4572_132]|nr:MAG: LPS export ABC transporter periplasmic protein LptC [Fusobacteriia bacterium 4572_132]
MLKKGLYIIMGGLFLFFLYNNYIKKEEIVINKINENIETKNIKYNIGKNYEIEAERLIEDQKSEETHFNMAKAIFDTLKIRGKEAVVDKYNNMILKGNIIGKSDNGWEFRTDKIKYNERKEEFYSETKVIAKKTDQNITIMSDKLKANSNFNIVTLYENVNLVSEKVQLTCKKARYDRTKEILKLSGNIRFKGKKIGSEKGEISRIAGNFNSAIYDLKRKKLTIWGKFEIYYLGYKIKANNMIYYNESGNINMYDNVSISKDDLNAKMKKVYYNNETKKMVLTGPIRGEKNGYNFEAKYGEIETDTENIKIIEDVMINNTENNMKLLADEIDYKKNNEILEIKSNRNKTIKMIGEDYKIETTEAEYDIKNQNMFIENKFVFTREKMEITGEKLKFKTDTKIGLSENNKLIDENLEINSKIVNFNLETKKYELKKEVEVETDEYKLITEKMIIDNNEERIKIPIEFKIIGLKRELKLNATNGEFFNKTKKFLIYDGVKVEIDDFIIDAKEMTYNMETEKGFLEKEIHIVNTKENIDIKADRANYNKGKTLLLTGNLKIKKDENELITEELEYKIDEEKAYLNKNGKLLNLSEDLIVNYNNANYDKQKSILEIEEINGRKEDVIFSSKKAEYDNVQKKFIMKQDVEIKKNDILIESEELIYFTEKKDVISENEIKIREKNLLIIAQKGKINIGKEEMQATDVILTTDEGDRMSGKRMEGSLSKKEFDFEGDLKAELRDDISFNGDKAKMFFIKNELEKYEVIRGEIKENAEFNYGEMKLISNYLEIDNLKNLVFGKGEPKLKIAETTDVKAEYIYLELEKEIGRMENNVKITNKGIENVGSVNATSDTALLRNETKKIELKGNVVVYKGKNKVQTNEGTMDLRTNVLSGIGNTKFKLSLEKKEEKEGEVDE